MRCTVTFRKNMPNSGTSVSLLARTHYIHVLVRKQMSLINAHCTQLHIVYFTRINLILLFLLFMAILWFGVLFAGFCSSAVMVAVNFSLMDRFHRIFFSNLLEQLKFKITLYPKDITNYISEKQVMPRKCPFYLPYRNYNVYLLAPAYMYTVCRFEDKKFPVSFKFYRFGSQK